MGRRSLREERGGLKKQDQRWSYPSSLREERGVLKKQDPSFLWTRSRPSQDHALRGCGCDFAYNFMNTYIDLLVYLLSSLSEHTSPSISPVFASISPVSLWKGFALYKALKAFFCAAATAVRLFLPLVSGTSLAMPSTFPKERCRWS